MANGEDWDESEWFNYLYNMTQGEPVESYVDYDLADQTAGRRKFTGWGEGNLTRESENLRSNYAQKLKTQQKLAEELRNQGVGGYINQLGNIPK